MLLAIELLSWRRNDEVISGATDAGEVACNQ